MGLLVIILGVIIWLMLSPLIGLLVVIAGLIMLFVPAVPYGYSHWRRPPP